MQAASVDKVERRGGTEGAPTVLRSYELLSIFLLLSTFLSGYFRFSCTYWTSAVRMHMFTSSQASEIKFSQSFCAVEIYATKTIDPFGSQACGAGVSIMHRKVGMLDTPESPPLKGWYGPYGYFMLFRTFLQRLLPAPLLLDSLK